MPDYTRRNSDDSLAVKWLTMFTAVVAGVFVAGLLLGLTLRAYLHHSIRDTLTPKKVEIYFPFPVDTRPPIA